MKAIIIENINKELKLKYSLAPISSEVFTGSCILERSYS